MTPFFLMHVVHQFHPFTVNVSAESVGGSTPGVRLTWSTALPPECVTSARVKFTTESYYGPVVATYTTTNTEVIQTGLHCATNYFITVVVSGRPILPVVGSYLPSTLQSQVQVFIGGKETVHLRFCNFILLMPFITQIHLYLLE